MEETESTTQDRTTGQDGSHAADHTLLMSSKPLHRFIQKEPKTLGIVILIFGCAEILMGFVLSHEGDDTSYSIYIPFWQGALFLACGNLSIYTEMNPSKKMVTVCLAMYVLSILGVVVSAPFRLRCMLHIRYLRHGYHSEDHSQLVGVESLLFTSSLCVSVLLIFLCAVARLALKSTSTQIIVQHIPLPPCNTTSN
ncbi:B-lymphocyte antigen CD20-like [Lycodopsis pacificus]